MGQTCEDGRPSRIEVATWAAEANRRSDRSTVRSVVEQWTRPPICCCPPTAPRAAFT
jgi:hypothetical protein